MKDMKEQVAKVRPLALYASLRIPEYYMVAEVRYDGFDEHYTKLPDGQKREIPFDGYVRISDPLETAFQPSNSDEVVQNAVASLDAAERKAVEELNAKIAAIREQKRQLMALTHQPEESGV